MERVIMNGSGKRESNGTVPNNRHLIFAENEKREELILSLRAKLLAIGIFLFFFIENGTLGFLPENFYYVFRSVRYSDLILYGLVFYSFMQIKEYSYLVKSKSFLIVKILLGYLVFEFIISCIRYHFNIIECFMRLKGTWTSFLVFPFMLLIVRGGLNFFFKLMLPFVVISNIFYILTALSGINFMAGFGNYIMTQELPGGITVFRVYGGTFYGEYFFLGFIYLWLTKKFRFYQLILAIIFIIPHILAFGRTAWVNMLFSIFVLFVFILYKKKKFKVFLRQSIVFAILTFSVIFAFLKFIPHSDYYVDALHARVTQGQEDVQYDEGSYGVRVNLENDVLLKLFSESNWLVGIGMHPLWVIAPENNEEAMYNLALSDVIWPGILACYGLIGFAICLALQIYLIITSYKLLKSTKEYNVFTLFLIIMFAKFLFDSIFTYTFVFFSVNMWGLYGAMHFLIAIFVFSYEKNRKENSGKSRDEILKHHGISFKYYKYVYKYNRIKQHTDNVI
jgi:hypothetical protein